MRKTLTFLLLPVLLSASNFAAAEMLFGYVVGITNGDTITLMEGVNLERRIRIGGIEVPEKGPLSDRAKQNLETLALGKAAAVEWSRVDRHGHIIGKVTVDGRDVALRQIEAGLARSGTRGKEPSEHNRSLYEDAEKQARAAGLGLWGDPLSVPPSAYRQHAAIAQSRQIQIH